MPKSRARAVRGVMSSKRQSTSVERRDRGAVAIPADSWTRRLGLLLVVLNVIAIPLTVDLRGAEAFTLPKAAVSQALTYPMVLTLGAHFLLVRRLPRGRAWLAVLAYLGVAVVATALAVHPSTALNGADHRFLGLTSILRGVILALAVAVFVRTDRDLGWLAAGLFSAAGLTLMYGLVQILRLDPIRWVDPMIGSTVGNSTAFAGYLAVIVGMAAAALLLRWKSVPLWQRLALIAIVLLGSVEILLAGARGPALALPVAFASAVAAVVIGRPSFRRPSRGSLIVGVVSLAVLLGGMALSPAGGRIGRLVAGTDTSVTERTVIYETSIEAIRARPLLGVGPDGLATVYLSLRPARSAQLANVVTPMQTSTHSWILHQAVGTGVIGLLAYLAMTAMAMRNAFSRLRLSGSWSAGMGMVGLISFLAQGMVSINHVGVEWLYWLSLGLALSPALPALEGHAGASRRRAWPEALGAVVALMVGLLLASTVLDPLEADRLIKASNTARLRGDHLLAARLAERAVQVDGSRADSWNVLGLARSAGSPESASRAFQKAWELAPYDSAYAINVAKESMRAAEKAPAFRDRALDYAAKAARVDPQNPESHVVYGFVLLQAGQPARAAEEADRAIGLRSVQVGHTLQAYFLASDAYKAMGRPDVAADRLRSALALAEERGHVMAGVIRLDLARLLHQIGQDAAARALIAPPRLIAVDRSCEPTYGFTEIPSIGKVPRCLKVVFAVGELLESDPSRADAVTRPDNFLLDGVPLPPRTDVRLVPPRPEESIPIAAAVEIQFRPDVPLPRPGAILTVRRVADRLGNVIRPDPASAPVR